MDFTGLFEMQGMLFTIMILGYIFRKAGMISDEGKSLLTDLVLYVTLPASIIKSFQIEFNHQILVSCIVVIVVAAGIQGGAWLLGMILYPGFPDERKKVLQYATICSNAGILGNPIAEGIFGSMGLLYASIYTIPQRTFMWSIGLTYFTQAPDMKTLIKKVSTHPGLSGAFIPVSEDQGMIDAVSLGALTIEKLEAMTCVCSVGLDMIAIPGDTPSTTIAGIIADEAAIGMVNQKTTAVRLIPVIGKKVGDTAEFGGLLGYAPIIPVNTFSCEKFVTRGGRIPAPIHSFKN